MMNRRLAYRGFTLVEMLITVFVLSILMAVATAFFQSLMSDGQKKECRDDMQTIGNAEKQYKLKSAAHAYTTTMSALTAQVYALPLCPSGGTYTLSLSNGTTDTAQNGQVVPLGWVIVTCSAAGHGKFAPCVDIN
jgi:type IV pilus assembly protein PilA